MNAELVLKVIEEGLVLLNKLVPDQSLKIANKIKSLRGRWDEEYSKTDKRDDAALDCIELELRDIFELYAIAIKSANSSDKFK